MRQMLRPAWVLLLWATWMLLLGSASVGGALLGVPIALGAAAWLAPVPVTARRARAGVLLRLGGRVLCDIVSANAVVAYQVLVKVRRLQPAFIEVPLRLQNESLVAVLGAIVSLTPGTLSVDFDTVRRVLRVHALDAPDPAAVVALVRTRYEDLLLELFA